MKKLTKIQRQSVFNMFDGHCAYCGEKLKDKWHVDHIEPIFRKTEFVKNERGTIVGLKQTGDAYREELHTLDNLFPSCPPCNLFKSSNSIEEFRKQLKRQYEIAFKRSAGFRIAEKYGLIQEIKKDIVFYFERKIL